MPDETLAAQIAETVYGLTPRQIVHLPPHFDWRGLFRLDDTEGATWVLRLLRGAEAADDLSATSRLLDWLAPPGKGAPAYYVRSPHSRCRTALRSASPTPHCARAAGLTPGSTAAVGWIEQHRP